MINYELKLPATEKVVEPKLVNLPILSRNINKRRPTGERTALKRGGSDTKVMPKKEKILEYIDDHNIVYGDKKSTKAELEAATKRIESYPKKMSKQDEYNIYFNKKSPKYYNRKIAKAPKPIKPDLVNGHSDWTSDDWLQIIDPGGWASDEDKRVEAESLYEKYLELLKEGNLLPGTTFQMFESNPMGYDIDAISKINKRVEDKKKSEGLATLLGVSSGRNI